MRLAIVLAVAMGFAGAAVAAEGPTKAQCHDGWKAEYTKMWTKADFTKACDSMKK